MGAMDRRDETARGTARAAPAAGRRRGDAYPVTNAVGNVRNEGPEMAARVKDTGGAAIDRSRASPCGLRTEIIPLTRRGHARNGARGKGNRQLLDLWDI